MERILLVIHVLTALAIIGFVLLQRGKGAEAGASFGAGASQTVFGSIGSWNFFSKVTAILATVFFVTSFALAIMAKNNASIGGAALPELETYQQQLESADDVSVPPAEQDYDIPVQEEPSDIPSDVPAAGTYD